MIYNEANFKILHQGIDTLVIGVKCTDEKIYNSSFSAFVSKIASLKSDAQQLRTFGEKYVLDDLGLKYGKFKISSKGLGQYFGFLQNDDIFCAVSDTKFNGGLIYHLKIQFRAVFLLKHGHFRAYTFVENFLDDIFAGRNYKISVLRLDLATDVTGIKYTPQDFLKFRSLKRISNYSEQTKKDDDGLLDLDEKEVINVDLTQININNFMRFNRFEGVSFGKNPHMFRVYDKIKQIQNKNISSLVFTKWELNGFNFDRDLFVFRHEVEFGRYAIKRLIPIGEIDEIRYIFTHLPAFWSQGLTICKWYDLTDKEIQKLTEFNYQDSGKRMIYARCDADENRLHLWDKLKIWGDDKQNALKKHDLLQSRDFKQAKKAFKAFIGAVYKNLGCAENNFLLVLDAVKQDLARECMNIHDYGMSKLAGSFNKNEKIIDIYDLDINNPLASLVFFAIDEFIEKLETTKNQDFKAVIEEALNNFKEQ